MSYTMVRCGNRVWIYEPGEGVAAAVERLVSRLKHARQVAEKSALMYPALASRANNWRIASAVIEITPDVDEEEITALQTIAPLLNLGIYRIRVVNGIPEPTFVVP